MSYKNIVFDIGNVLVRWDPDYIVRQAFPDRDDHTNLVQAIFKHATWINHNLGKTTECQILEEYHFRLGIEKSELTQMMQIVKRSLIPIEGSFDLLKSLYTARYRLYALTDNTKEIMAYLTQAYDFWNYFQGVVVSAEVGFLKPSTQIFNYLLETYQLNAKETVFIDDYLTNVEGAKQVGIRAIQFQNSQQCQQDLAQLGIQFIL